MKIKKSYVSENTDDYDKIRGDFIKILIKKFNENISKIRLEKRTKNNED